MTDKATSNYVHILALGRGMADRLALERPSNMTDWPQLENEWRQVELRLRTRHGYDVLRGMLDTDVALLLHNVRRRLHYWATALRFHDYAALLGDSYQAVQQAALEVATTDQTVLIDKGTHYGDSWKKRGGVGAFMMLARKWDRLENILGGVGSGPELVAALRRNPGNVQDDAHDLRRYLLLVEDEAANQRLDGGARAAS